MKVDYSRIPDLTMQSLKHWVERGQPTGSFLRAVLSNDLQEAFSRADDRNIVAMFDIVCWLRNRAPIGSWGSPSVLANWPKQLRGMGVINQFTDPQEAA